MTKVERVRSVTAWVRNITFPEYRGRPHDCVAELEFPGEKSRHIAMERLKPEEPGGVRAPIGFRKSPSEITLKILQFKLNFQG